MMKKICFLLAVLVMISCLSGCGEKNTNATTELKRTSEENPVTLSKLENAFCDDDEKFSISGTTATHQWNGIYNRVISAEVSEENKINSITIEYTNLNTETFQSSNKLSELFNKSKSEWSGLDAMLLMPMWDLNDVMTLIGANESEITNELMVDIVVNGDPFMKNGWTVQVSIGDDGASFVANYGA